MGNIPCCETESKERPAEPQPSPIKLAPAHSTPSRLPSAKGSETRTPGESVRTARGRGPEDYQSRKYLGRGAFGCVVLAEEKESGRLFAMKIIEKSKIREFNVLQCELMQRIGRQDFLVGIRETFQNQSRVYIIMEYLPKGDLYFYLRKKEIPFTEPTIRGILAEIVVGVGILHSYGLIYRELKPENLLVTEDGHLKLTDYGLSKVIVEHEQSVETFVGTLEYMAPEALKGQFGQKADIWSLGVLMFELMFRENPFEAEEQPERPLEEYKTSIENNLINSRVNAKIGYMSLAFRDLLLRLIEKDPERRLSL